MCGINGFLTNIKSSSYNLNLILKETTDLLYHRGPDSNGFWSDSENGIYLGHRRLSILDLSPAGAQPMMSKSGRYIIVLNGEIYNHNLIREELLKHDCNIIWNGTSDTETLVESIEILGISDTLKLASGMFSFALWDTLLMDLTLARDKFGEKPLYCGWQHDTFFFSSELKAIRNNPIFNAEIDRRALSKYVKYAYIPAPYSIYKGISKLTPGMFVTVSLSRKSFEPNIYWSSSERIICNYKNPYIGDRTDAVESLNKVLRSAIKEQMISDVPLGAFLSGGVDSSTVVALMQDISDTPIKTFSIGFDQPNYNEAHHAKAVADYLGTDHTELYIKESDAQKIIPKLSKLYDEPFADSSQIPTFLVSQLARKKVTVSLSGDGADELFGGYNRYILTKRLWNKLSIIPLFVRRFTSSMFLKISPEKYNLFFRRITFGGTLFNQANVGDKIHKALNVISSNSYLDLYDKLISSWKDPSSIIIGLNDSDIRDLNLPHYSLDIDPISQMMGMDLITYLPDDILCKVDRAAMGVSLETRVPFLNSKIMEFAWSLPLNFKISNNTTKWVLREVLYKYVPKHLIERPKMGFGIPLDSWLRGELKEWAEKLLNEDRLIREGFFNPREIRIKWDEHLSGKRNWQHQLWVILMFQSWLEDNK